MDNIKYINGFTIACSDDTNEVVLKIFTTYPDLDMDGNIVDVKTGEGTTIIMNKEIAAKLSVTIANTLNMLNNGEGNVE